MTAIIETFEQEPVCSQIESKYFKLDTVRDPWKRFGLIVRQRSKADITQLIMQI